MDTALFDKTGTVYRASQSKDSAGEVTTSWTFAGSITCALQQRSVTVADGQGGIKLTSVAVLYCAHGSDIKPGVGDGGMPDKVVVDSLTYLVTGVVNMAGRDEMLMCSLEAVA